MGSGFKVEYFKGQMTNYDEYVKSPKPVMPDPG